MTPGRPLLPHQQPGGGRAPPGDVLYVFGFFSFFGGVILAIYRQWFWAGAGMGLGLALIIIAAITNGLWLARATGAQILSDLRDIKHHLGIDQ